MDGVVTDDNDVFLFGGRHVYRHLFDNQRYVEEYHMDDVARELGLGRSQLVALALLLGSDYTEGVAGVGVVNAVEIVQVGVAGWVLVVLVLGCWWLCAVVAAGWLGRCCGACWWWWFVLVLVVKCCCVLSARCDWLGR